MTIPATTALLADMRDPTASAAGADEVVSGGTNYANDASSSHGRGCNGAGRCSLTRHRDHASNMQTESRRPLEAIQNRTNDCAAAKTNEKGSGERTMGPNEVNYRRNYDPFVAMVIAQHSARMQTNLRRDCTLPDYHRMNSQERSAALQSVDKILEWLSNVGISNDATVVEGERNGLNSQSAGVGHETVGSAATMHEAQHDETLESVTTLGESNAEDEISKKQSTESVTTLGNNKSLSSATTLGCGDQSASLLEKSMALLSDDEIGGDNDEEAHFSGQENDQRRQRQKEQSSSAAPVERTRHYQSDLFHHQLTSLASSNSGKRGHKSRHRGNDDAEDDSSMSRFSDIEGSGDGNHDMCLHDQEDVFSCGTSPIQRRFSGDCRMESRCGGGEDGLPDKIKSARFGGKGHEGDECEKDDYSHFSYQDDNESSGNGDDFHCNGDFDDDEPLTMNATQNNQLSQWSTFRNANVQVAPSQIDGEDDESPVRRRAIRFDGASRQTQAAGLRSQLKIGRRQDKDSSKSVIEEEEEAGTMAEAVAKDHPRKKQGAHNGSEDDDPIETVRNLCRRAGLLEEQGVDSSLLEEVAPIDIQLRDGMHFRMDALRCRQGEFSKYDRSKSSKEMKKSKSVSIVDLKGRDFRSNDASHTTKGSSQFELSDSEMPHSDPESSFKDPLSDFPSRVAARLNGGLSFLSQKEGQTHDDDQHSSAVLLSMTIQQIVCVVCKLLAQTAKSTRLHQRSKNGRPASSSLGRYTPSLSSISLPKENDYLAGGTLIILRGKEDIPRWEVALREYTSLSVLSHASMQSTLRKLADTAGKCAGFDVVLTTYDAIKSKEVTVPVDHTGCAILRGSAMVDGDKDGWFRARDAKAQSGAAVPQKCYRLSILHRMSWFRVVFVDILGRKGFLTKPGTARAQAAVAINSKLRFAFFGKEDGASKVEDKFKNDRRQLRSIITALHLPEHMKLDNLIDAYILDVHQVGKAIAGIRHDSSSSDSNDGYNSENDDMGVQNCTEAW